MLLLAMILKFALHCSSLPAHSCGVSSSAVTLYSPGCSGAVYRTVRSSGC